MLTSFSGIGTSRSRSHQDSSVAHDRDGAVDLHHPQQHYYTLAAVLIRRGFPSLSNAQGIGIALGLGFIAGSTHEARISRQTNTCWDVYTDPGLFSGKREA